MKRVSFARFSSTLLGTFTQTTGGHDHLRKVSNVSKQIIVLSAIRLPIHSPYVASDAAESEGVTGCNIGAILLEYIRAPSIWWRRPPKRRSAIPQTVSITHYEKGRREDSGDTTLLIPKEFIAAAIRPATEVLNPAKKSNPIA